MTRARDLADSADKDISGTLTLDDIVLSNDMTVADNGKVIFGAGSDLQLYHDGSNSYVDDAGSGRLYLRGNDRVQIQKYTGDDMITAIADGAVKLYYDNSNKLETTSSGVTISGDLAVTSGTDAALSVNDAVGEVGSGNLALQVTNSAGSALKPLGFRAENIRFATGSAERVRIIDDGITFNGDTAAANALDDYETGTCTLTSPSSVANATGVAHAYANFIKIGNLVTIQGAFDSVNHNSGRIAFTAHVPFAMATTSNTGQLGVCSVYPNSTDESSGYVLNNTGGNNTQIYFEMQSDASNSSGTVSYNLSYRAA